MTIDEITKVLATHGHCSAIIKVADDFSELFSGHSTW